MSFISNLKSKIEKAAHKTLDLVDVTESNNRMSICSSCPHMIKATVQCAKCGCFMKAKTKLKSAKCPIGKW